MIIITSPSIPSLVRRGVFCLPLVKGAGGILPAFLVARFIGGVPLQVILKTLVGEDNGPARHSVQAKLGPASRWAPHKWGNYKKKTFPPHSQRKKDPRGCPQSATANLGGNPNNLIADHTYLPSIPVTYRL